MHVIVDGVERPDQFILLMDDRREHTVEVSVFATPAVSL